MRRFFTTPDALQANTKTEVVHIDIVEGLSSGEGLIWQVRDPMMKKEAMKDKGRIVGYQEVVADEGVTEKQLLVLEAGIFPRPGRHGARK